jgi:TetR/AcrR family transcriptional repressor of nem operon
MSETRQKLLDTAIELIWEQSYNSVSVDDICNQSGVKKGSFYHFFPSKSELAVAAYEEHWQHFYKPLYADIFYPDKPPLQRVEDWCNHIIAKQLDIFKRKGRVLGCPYASIGSELVSQDDKILKKTNEIFARATLYIETALHDAAQLGLIADKNIAQIASEIFSYMIGVLVIARINNNPAIISRDLHKGVFNLIAQEARTPAAA